MINNNPFLKLLNNEKIKKMKIDAELIPIFKIVISKINNYFTKNDLLGAKDWDSIFENYLLTNNDEQFRIILGNTKYASGGYFDEANKTIGVDINDKDNKDYLIDSLCHEFIHFLSRTRDSKTNIGFGVTDTEILDEGLTELLTMRVLNTDKTRTNYFDNIHMAKFYALLSGERFAFYNFLNRYYTFENETSQCNIYYAGRQYENTGSLEPLKKVQRELIGNLFDYQDINTIDKLISKLNILDNRLLYDEEYISEMYEKIVLAFLSNIGLSDDINLKNTLIDFCWIKSKANLYGKNAVCEYKIDNILIALDKNGEDYIYNFPRGLSIHYDSYDDQVVIKYKGYEYPINLKEMKCLNWTNIYKEQLRIVLKGLRKAINNKDMSVRKYSKPTRKIF